MKSIKERAQNSAHSYRRVAHDLSGERSDAYYSGFIAGAESEHAELTRWHDPKEELPEEDSTVLCKVAGYTESDYLTLSYSNNSWWMFHTESSQFGPVGYEVFFPHEVLAWRKIHE